MFTPILNPFQAYFEEHPRGTSIDIAGECSMSHADDLHPGRSHSVGDFTDRDDATQRHLLQTIRLVAGGAIVGVALYGMFTKNAPDDISHELIAALVGAVLALVGLRSSRVF